METKTTTEPKVEEQSAPETPATKPGRVKARTDITYWHDGKPMPGSHSHKLSTLAYFHSGGIDTLSPKRVSTKRFVEILNAADVTDPGQPGWMVKLPNGVVVECRIDGEPSKYSGPVKAAKATAKSTTPRRANGTIAPKPAAKRAPAKKASKVSKSARATAVKAATSSARAKSNVVPLPKKSTRSTRAN